MFHYVRTTFLPHILAAWCPWTAYNVLHTPQITLVFFASTLYVTDLVSPSMAYLFQPLVFLCQWSFPAFSSSFFYVIPSLPFLTLYVLVSFPSLSLLTPSSSSQRHLFQFSLFLCGALSLSLLVTLSCNTASSIPHPFFFSVHS